MASHDSKSVPSTPLGAPRELILVVGAALGLFLAVGSGSIISSYVPDNSPWLFAAAFGVPTAGVFAVYWWIARRL